jgi:hypothetical protein
MNTRLAVSFCTFGRFVRRYRIRRLCERCAGLKAKIDYWDSLGAVTDGGLPSWRCQTLGEWREDLASLLVRKTWLEGGEVGQSCTPNESCTPNAGVKRPPASAAEPACSTFDYRGEFEKLHVAAAQAAAAGFQSMAANGVLESAVKLYTDILQNASGKADHEA